MVFTDSPPPMLTAEADHRRHAIIEQVIVDLKNGPLAHLPSKSCAANSAWLVLAAMAFNLLRATGTLDHGLNNAPVEATNTHLRVLTRRPTASTRPKPSSPWHSSPEADSAQTCQAAQHDQSTHGNGRRSSNILFTL